MSNDDRDVDMVPSSEYPANVLLSCSNKTAKVTDRGPGPVDITLFSFTLICIFVLLVASVVLHRLRDTKIGRAGSPNLLFVAIFGCLLMYVEVLVRVFPPTPAICLLQMWFRHVGFMFCVLGLLLRQHRIYSIIHQRNWKNAFFRDRSSYQVLCIMVTLSAIFLAAWSALHPEVPITNVTGHIIGCTLNAGSYINITGELALGTLLLYFCVQTRQVPSPYNDCVACGFIAYNILSGTALESTFRGQGAENLWMYTGTIASFYRVHSLATSILFGVVCGRIYVTMFPRMELSASIATVTSPDHGHKLRIVLKQNGDIKTVTCFPCGPLMVFRSTEEESATVDSSAQFDKQRRQQQQCAGYTEEEIDRLVSLYNAQKQEIKILNQLIETSAATGSYLDTPVPSSPTPLLAVNMQQLYPRQLRTDLPETARAHRLLLQWSEEFDERTTVPRPNAVSAISVEEGPTTLNTVLCSNETSQEYGTKQGNQSQFAIMIDNMQNKHEFVDLNTT